MTAGVLPAFAQGHRNHPSFGIDIGVPVYSVVGDMKGLLAGVYAKQEWQLNRIIGATASAGYQYFNGTAKTFDGKEVNDYAVVPLLIGLKCYALKRTYLGFETGLHIAAHTNSSTRMALVPSIGTMVPLGTKQIDIGIRYNATKLGTTYPEAPLFRRGGYALLGLRVGLSL